MAERMASYIMKSRSIDSLCELVGMARDSFTLYQLVLDMNCFEAKATRLAVRGIARPIVERQRVADLEPWVNFHLIGAGCPYLLQRIVRGMEKCGKHTQRLGAIITGRWSSSANIYRRKDCCSMC